MAIQNFPRPRNQKKLKEFLGITNFYNRFTSKHAEVTQHLLTLLQKGQWFVQTIELEVCFQHVKKLFIECIILKYPQINKRYCLQTDTHKYAYGDVILTQWKQCDWGYSIHSKTFKGAEHNYFTMEKVLLAIVRCVDKFCIYILGQPLTFFTYRQ